MSKKRFMTAQNMSDSPQTEKICFVVARYGEDICGGAEYHCRMLAERLVPHFEVEVLTTKSNNYLTFEMGYTDNRETINGVEVLRFDCKPKILDKEEGDKLWRRSKWRRKLRRNLFRLGLLKAIANICPPKWNFGLAEERTLLQTDAFYSPDLLAYLEKNHGNYKAVVFFTYLFPHTVFGFRIAPEKSILIPTAHEESLFFRPMHTHLFAGVRHIAFNTEEERRLAQRVFGRHLSPSSIVAVGVETDVDTSALSDEEMRAKYNLPDRYVHYFGRIVSNKIGKIIPWFLDYKRRHPGDLKLVLTGKLFQKKVDHPDIIYTGFVSPEEKIWLIKNALLAVNPSKHESLSLLLLEAMKLGKMVLVNGRSDVMKAHCIRSGFAADYYLSKQDFQRKLHRYASNPELLEANSQKAKNYVETNYDWAVIMGKLKALIDSI